MALTVLPSLCWFSIFLGLICPAFGSSYGGQQAPVLKVCGKGYFLSKLSKCLPCNCGGHSINCEDITGICIDCQNNTKGDFCEECHDGFTVEITAGGDHICWPCACPLPLISNNFAVSCEKRGKTERCMCQEGYAGPICERCAPGYYGNPLRVGDTCKKCDCNGNTDPNLIFSDCHNVTGHCQTCWRNTAGVNCERCAPGFFGDAISAKNCRECPCNKCGTQSCDDRTGRCHCKPGVTGPLCDRCEAGYSGFTSCLGCRKCECALASVRRACNPLTQACECQPGATGQHCEHCSSGYWKYGPSGCQECDCDGGPCDSRTGECLPEPSVPPKVCNISCDECIWYLIDDILSSNKTLQEVKANIINISTGAVANSHLSQINATILHLQSQFRKWRNQSDIIKTQTAVVKDAALVVQTNLEKLEEKESSAVFQGKKVDQETRDIYLHADQLKRNLFSLGSQIQDIVSDWAFYSVVHDLTLEEVSQRISESEYMVENMRKIDFPSQEPTAKEEAVKAQELRRKVLQLGKRLNSTVGQISPIRNQISDFSRKLSDSREFLGEAVRTTHSTVEKNKDNLVKFQRNEDLRDALMENYGMVNETLQLAGDVITDTGLIAAELDTLIKNVSEFHAAVDGAGGLLKQKADNLSRAEGDLVHRAAEHARELQRLALDLEYNLKNIDANGFVQKAVNASNVYENIVKYIEEANATAETTLNFAQRADDAISGITAEVGFNKQKSREVFVGATNVQTRQDESEASLSDNRKYVDETKETMSEVRQKLSEALSRLNTIDKVNTAQRLTFARGVAESTLNNTAQVLQSISPVNAEVQEWARNLNNSEYDTSAYKLAVNTAGEAVESLTEIVPELLDKLRVVEEKKPVKNISTNIMRIRELIAQARSVARKVQVSMKFDGQTAVEVHPQTNLEELKTVTSISLYMKIETEKEPVQNRFIFYLGNKNGRKDYMGLAIKNNNLVYIYNLGGGDIEIPLSSKPVSTWPPSFNLVKVERLGRHGKVFFTVPSTVRSTAEQKFIQKGEAPGVESLFDLDPDNTVLFVGGVPPDFRLPSSLNLPAFVGCIELGTMNNEVVSLYHFKQTHNVDTTATPPCPRNKLAFAQSKITSYLFDGTGFALINNIGRRGKFGAVTRFDFEVRTVVDNGLLLLMVNGTNFFILEIKDGLLSLVYDFGFSKGPVTLESNSTKLRINDARSHEISVIYHQSKKVILLVDRSHIKTLESEQKQMPFSDIYIGGAPSSILMSRPELAALVGLKGCLRGFQFQKKDFNLLEEPGSIGISYGCPEELFMSHQAYFKGESFLSSSAKISPFHSFEGGFNFRTLQSDGLLFYHSNGPDEFAISLENGAIILNSKGVKVQSDEKHYSDGKTHFLVASVTPEKYQLIVDDKDKQARSHAGSSQSAASAPNKFYFGGTPSSQFLNFTGCISNAYFSRHDRDIEVEDFLKYTEKVQTSLYGCPIEKPPAALHLKQGRNTSRSKKGKTKKVGRDKLSIPHDPISLKISPEEHPGSEKTHCYLSSQPRATLHAHHYGGIANSRQEYGRIPQFFNERSHFSLSLRTHSSFGLIFYVSDEAEDNYMALFLAHGKLIYTFNAGSSKLKIKSQEKYNDGMWHNVIFTRSGNEGRLIIDGLRVLEERIPTADTLWRVAGPFYVGGVPPGKSLKNIQKSSVYSFTGCIKDFQLNGEWMSSITQTFGVTPCFEEPSESGTYFSEDGGYLVLDDSYNLGLRFELVFEVRPRAPSGVLLHLYTAEGHYLNMHLHQGQVVVQVNNGIREFATRVTPKQSLCDGRWHRIAVIRDANVVQLDVDSEVNHVVGPLNHRAVDSRTPVFIGGAPASLLPQSLVTHRPYTGCMRSLAVNETPVSFGKAALVSGAVGVGSCPAE
ncbi:laminin subunit alpha-4 [Lepisosteus oculatus]|uniref:laminin subunit alpha-4 n=1 Tax=Lepisosteus oculatus TaxID=7918 RepID=UPI0035F526C8